MCYLIQQEIRTKMTWEPEETFPHAYALAGLTFSDVSFACPL